MRDPRTDPAKGDIVRFREDFEHQVTGVDKERVNYERITPRGEVSPHSCSLGAWWRWCAREEVRTIKVAGA